MRTLLLEVAGGAFGCCCRCLMLLGVPPPSRTHIESSWCPLDRTCWGPLACISCCRSWDCSFWETFTSLLVRFVPAEVYCSSVVGVHERLQGRSGGPALPWRLFFMPAVGDRRPSPFWDSKHCRGNPGTAVHSILPVCFAYRGKNEYWNATPKTGIVSVIWLETHNGKYRNWT